MSNRFIDVKPGHYAYDEIIEATNTFTSEGKPLMSGLPYQIFEENKPYIYREFKSTKGQLTFKLPVKVTITDENPLQVFVNGVMWAYKSASIVGTETHITLFTSPKENALVSIISYGVVMMSGGRPFLSTEDWYPSYSLTYSDKYIYYPHLSGYEVVFIFGKKMKRTEIDPTDYNMSNQELARKYIADKQDVYIITPSGRIYVPGNFENMTGTITYAYNVNGQDAPVTGSSLKRHTEEFKAVAGTSTDGLYPRRTDRFFPDEHVTREDLIVAISRLRQNFLDRFTDSKISNSGVDQTIRSYNGQKVFNLDGTYPNGEGLLKVYKYILKDNPTSSTTLLVCGVDYDEFNEHTILMKQPQDEGFYFKFEYMKAKSARFEDAGKYTKYWNVDLQKSVVIESDEPWVNHLLAIEDDVVDDGYVVVGSTVDNYADSSKTIPVVNAFGQNVDGNDEVRKDYYLPRYRIPKYEAIQTLNRFRKWCLDRFI